jgi:hypothetical protein
MPLWQGQGGPLRQYGRNLAGNGENLDQGRFIKELIQTSPLWPITKNTFPVNFLGQ